MLSRYASVLALGLMTATAARAAAPGTAHGNFTVNGKSTPLSYAVATTQKNPFDEKKTDVLLLLTSAAVDPAVLADHFGRMRLANKGNFTGIEVEIDESGSVISCMLYSPEFVRFNGKVSSSGTQEFTGKVTATSIEGKISVPEEDDVFGYTCLYSVTFRAAITSEPKPARAGQPLPADGGAPGKAYLDYLAALESGSEARLARFVDAEHAARMKDPEFKKMLKMIQAMEPKNVKIVRGSMDGSKATLEVTGSDGNSTSTGTVELVLEGGAWKLAKESWNRKG
jgi:hypothetical protein